MASIFNSSSLELMALSPRELAFKIRSEGCVFDLPPLVQVLPQKLEENDAQDFEDKVTESETQAESLEAQFIDIENDIAKAQSFLEDSLMEKENSILEIPTEESVLYLKENDLVHFQNLLEGVRNKVSILDPYPLVPEL